MEFEVDDDRDLDKSFLELAERFLSSDDPEQVKRLGDKLGRLLFGE